MKKLISFVIMLLLAGGFAFGQDKERLSSLELGAGFTMQYDKLAVLNLAFTTEIGSGLAAEFGYNMGRDKSSTEFHELSVKFGPCLKLGNAGYVLLATGVSFLTEADSGWKESSYYNYSSSENPWDQTSSLISVPIETKLNLAIYKWLGTGMKYTYYKNFEEGVNDWSTLQVFLSFKL